jgi:hypothetical protein
MRCYAKILASSLPALEETFGPSLSLARVPRWLKVSPEVAGTKAAQRPTTMAISPPANDSHAKAKAPMVPALRLHSPTKTATVKAAALVKAIPVKATPALNCGPQPYVSSATLGRVTFVKDLGVADCKAYFGDSFNLLSLRKTLMRL